MWNLLKLIFVGGCFRHKWRVEEIRNLKDEGDLIGKVYYLRCEKCGDVKRKEFY